MGNTQQAKADLWFGDDRYSVGKSIVPSKDCTGSWDGNTAVFTLGSGLGTFDSIVMSTTSEPTTIGNMYWFKILSKNPDKRTVTCGFVDSNNNVVNPRDTGLYSTSYISGYWYVGGYLNVKGSSTVGLSSINYNIPNVRGSGSINTCVDNKGVMRYDGEIVYTAPLTEVQFDSIQCDGINQLVLDIKAARINGDVVITYDDEYCNGKVKDVIWMYNAIHIIPTDDAKGLTMINPISSVNITDKSLGVSDTSTNLIVSDSSYAIQTTINEGQFISLSVLAQ